MYIGNPILAYGELNPGNAAKIILKMYFTHLLLTPTGGVLWCLFFLLFYVNFKMGNLKRNILKFKTTILKFHFQEREYIQMNIKNIKVYTVERYMGMERLI